MCNLRIWNIDYYYYYYYILWKIRFLLSDVFDKFHIHGIFLFGQVIKYSLSLTWREKFKWTSIEILPLTQKPPSDYNQFDPSFPFQNFRETLSNIIQIEIAKLQGKILNILIVMGKKLFILLSVKIKRNRCVLLMWLFKKHLNNYYSF